jgi:hypothetical protein
MVLHNIYYNDTNGFHYDIDYLKYSLSFLLFLLLLLLSRRIFFKKIQKKRGVMFYLKEETNSMFLLKTVNIGCT